MARKRKAFSPDLFRTYDDVGKLAVANFLGLSGFEHVVWDPEGQYGVDIMAEKPEGARVWAEVEVRPWCWNDDGWIYPTVHFLERKVKYLRHGFFLFATDQPCKRAVVVPERAIRQSMKAGPVVVRNREVENGELFYDVPFDPAWIRSLV